MTYYHRFIPNFATVAARLNRLRKNNAIFKWDHEEETSFQKLKDCLVNATRLVPYNSEFPAILATDASSYGVGAVLSLRYPDASERPIAFASKTLNDAEKGYSQIEKEALSIIFGVKKFHQYLYGRSFELITDHKPLVSLFHPNKQLPVYTLSRLQRWAITLMSYRFTIRYRATEKHQNADALSRLPCGPDMTFDSSEECCSWITEDLMDNVTHFPLSFKQVAQETQKDLILQDVLLYTTHGWPDSSPSNELKPYFDRRFALTVQSGVLLLQCDYPRVVIPSSLQSSILQLLHTAHWGIVRMKQMARRHCWWFHMDKNIESLSKSCVHCQQLLPNPKKEFQSWPTPTKPWERVHIDFAGPFWNSMWLIIVDAFSKFPFVIKMNNTTADSTIDALRQVFLLEGPPDTLVSDNGAQLTSNVFKDFCTKAGITHLTTAPFHPSSNGEAERFVRTFKGAMKKAWLDKKNKSDALNTVLFTYRTTPSPSKGKSPAELLHGRQPKTLLALLQPPCAANLNTGGKQTTKFQVGDNVLTKFFSGPNRWVKGNITDVLGKMMYTVNTEKGIVRRHQNQLRMLQKSTYYVNRQHSRNTQILNHEEDHTTLPLAQLNKIDDANPELQPSKPPEKYQELSDNYQEKSLETTVHSPSDADESQHQIPCSSLCLDRATECPQTTISPQRQVTFDLPPQETDRGEGEVPRRSGRIRKIPQRYSP